MTVYTTTIAKTNSIVVPFADMPKAAQEKIIAYGCQRIFNDMVGGAERFPTVEDKVKHVEAQIARFLAGDIGRQAAAGVSAEVSIGRSLVRAVLKAKYGAKSPEWAAFTGLTDDEQNAKLDALFERNKAKFAEEVEVEMLARAARAKKRAKQADALEMDI